MAHPGYAHVYRTGDIGRRVFISISLAELLAFPVTALMPSAC